MENELLSRSSSKSQTSGKETGKGSGPMNDISGSCPKEHPLKQISLKPPRILLPPQPPSVLEKPDFLPSGKRKFLWYGVGSLLD